MAVCPFARPNNSTPSIAMALGSMYRVAHGHARQYLSGMHEVFLEIRDIPIFELGRIWILHCIRPMMRWQLRPAWNCLRSFGSHRATLLLKQLGVREEELSALARQSMVLPDYTKIQKFRPTLKCSNN